MDADSNGSTAASRRLRMGVLAPSTELAGWQRRVLEHLIEGDDVELAVVVVDAARVRRSRRERLRQLFGVRGLWRLYNNAWVARRAAAIRRVDCEDLLGGLPQERVTPDLVGRHSQHFPPEAIERLRSHDLDVLLRFGFGILRGEVLEVARSGIWSFHHDDERVIRGGPPSFWEVADGHPTTGVLLQRLTKRLDAGVPLARATYRTVGHSYPRNRDRAAFGAAILPARVARATRLGHLDIARLPAARTDAPIRRDPTNREMLRFAVRHARRAVLARARSILVGARWAVGIAERDNGDRATPGPGELRWLPERPRGYDADPFPVEHAGVRAVLVEEFDEPAAHGVISAFTETAAGSWRRTSQVIDPGVHASYPFPVTVGDELFCVPETARAGRAEAWRCVALPDRWVRAHTLVEAPVIDPTVLHWQGRWWLFGTRRDGDPNAELWLWSADEFTGPWSPHPLNPVKIDVGSARPAGTPFVRDGVLHRPAQDCSNGYGGAVVINRVDRLDWSGFEETVVERADLRTDRYPVGNHTLAFGAGLVAIDGKRSVVDGDRSRRELIARLRRGR